MTPPTYSPWLKPFERLARLGLLRRRPNLGTFTVGDPDRQHDVELGQDWRNVRSSKLLYELWGPPPASDWSPYHRPTLFASIDALKGIVHPLAAGVGLERPAPKL